jgi:ribosomal protein L7Ae-like RNA K-turn-binding protein
MGIKQCTTMAKTGRAVLVVLAPNTETAEVIDDKLETLIQHCRDREIPILYALSKRRLGKAINATIKQSVVAVSQPDGCYDIFKKIIKFCESSEDKK